MHQHLGVAYGKAVEVRHRQVADARAFLALGDAADGCRFAAAQEQHIAFANVAGADPAARQGPAAVFQQIDLADRLVGGLTPPGSSCDETGSGEPGSDCSDGGHGTHVAGISAGDATSGLVDANGFLYGLGVAPGASLFALNVFNSITLVDAVKEAALGGSIGSNNSWSSTGVPGAGYTLDARIEDIAVRDANLDTTGVAEPFLQIFSAGNWWKRDPGEVVATCKERYLTVV